MGNSDSRQFFTFATATSSGTKEGLASGCVATRVKNGNGSTTRICVTVSIEGNLESAFQNFSTTSYQLSNTAENSSDWPVKKLLKKKYSPKSIRPDQNSRRTRSDMHNPPYSSKWGAAWNRGGRPGWLTSGRYSRSLRWQGISTTNSCSSSPL